MRKGGDPRTFYGKIYGQEKNLTTSEIARMNLVLHGIEDFQIAREDTLRSPAFTDSSTGGLATFDCVIANPPFSLKEWGSGVVGKPTRGRAPRSEFPPETYGDYAFVQHMIASMTTTGNGPDRRRANVHGFSDTAGARRHLTKTMPAMLPSTDLKASAPRTIAFSMLNSPAHPYRYRRFACPLAGADTPARGETWFGYSFVSGDLHPPYLLPVRLAHQTRACAIDALGSSPDRFAQGALP